MKVSETKEFEKDLKKLRKKIRSVESDARNAVDEVSGLSALELAKWSATDKLCNPATFQEEGKPRAQIYKLRVGTDNPKTSSRDGVRVWFAVIEEDDPWIISCGVQPKDKNNKSQQETIIEIKSRISQFYDK